jgi:hypothetical protein
MKLFPATVAALVIAAAGAQAQPQQQRAAALNQPGPEVLKFAVNRNGDQIGTYTIELRRAGPETTVSLATRIEVKVAFIVAYRFEHSASERWVNGKLVSMKTTTDDNGTPHKVEVVPKGTGVVVEADGKSTQFDSPVSPASLWNVSLLKQSIALDPQKGGVMKMAVTDGGMESITVQGKTVKAHRYTIKNTPAQDKPFSQDVWYDEKGTLVQVQFVVSQDGSIISYELQ